MTKWHFILFVAFLLAGASVGYAMYQFRNLSAPFSPRTIIQEFPRETPIPENYPDQINPVMWSDKGKG